MAASAIPMPAPANMRSPAPTYLPVQSGPAFLQVRTPDDLNRMDADRAAAARAAETDVATDNLAAYIRGQFDMMRNHRSTVGGWNERLLAAQRTFNREYDAAKLAEIRKFGGSEVYAGVTAVKSRSSAALLREVYLGGDRPWSLEATPVPTLPDDILEDVYKHIDLEAQANQEQGGRLDLSAIRDRTVAMVDEAMRAAKRKAADEAEKATDALDDLLVEGGFYDALREFLTDLTIFPFACIKGPVVRIVSELKWVKGRAVHEDQPKLFWNRVSPFDLYFTPGAARIEDADVIERSRTTRAALNACLGLPGFNQEALKAVLREYRNGLRDWIDPTDQERAVAENRESPSMNRSGMIDQLEFHGNVQGSMLLEHGFTEEEIDDPERDYLVQAWLIGRYVIKVQMSPSVRKRHPYYLTSFEKVPGTPVGNSIPDILGDVQDVLNGCYRSLVNNMAMSSGPQVVVHDDRLSDNEDGEEIYPHKRWHVQSDPLSNNNQTLPPVDFFSVPSVAQELLMVFDKMSQYADEFSALPRFITGNGPGGGAGRTSSGLAMLMGNTAKMLQTVCANVDSDVVRPMLQALYDLKMLTQQEGPNMLRGDESIRARGVEVAVQRETDRQRQMEFLQATANPIDMEIIGPDGRAKVLRQVSKNLGMADDPVPTADELEARQKAAALQAQQAALAAQIAGVPPGGGQPQGSPPAPKGTPSIAAPSGPPTPGADDGAAMRGMT